MDCRVASRRTRGSRWVTTKCLPGHRTQPCHCCPRFALKIAGLALSSRHNEIREQAVDTESDWRTMTEAEDQLARLIVETLNLDFDIATADADTPLYREGFALDSIDILEVALAVEQRYGVKLRADDENNVEIFRSLGSLCTYIHYADLP